VVGKITNRQEPEQKIEPEPIEPEQEPETKELLPFPDELRLGLERAEASYAVERIYNICSVYLTVKSDTAFMNLSTNPEDYLIEILGIFKEFHVVE